MVDAQVNPYFLALLREYEMLGLLGLGKIADPASGESAVDLARTQFAIGILEMLEEKTAGQLINLEKQELQRVVTTLRLNFVEEAQKQSSAKDETGEKAAAGEEAERQEKAEGEPQPSADKAEGE